MRYVNLGKSGLKVSPLCLGCMSFGEPGGALDLTLTAADRQLLDDAYTPNRHLGLLR
jgi:aryl-alcohol dehydrogenase-like predicted oxidoreductase